MKDNEISDDIASGHCGAECIGRDGSIESWGEAEGIVHASGAGNDGGLTRTHTIAEIFSALTGGSLSIRLDADEAALTLDNLAKDLDFVDLTPEQTLQALKQARRRGVRGGRIHDFLHAVAAEKSGASQLLTLDRNDFKNLIETVTVDQV